MEKKECQKSLKNKWMTKNIDFYKKNSMYFGLDAKKPNSTPYF